MTRANDVAIRQIIESIEIPDSGYETAERRYKDVATWFGRAESRCAKFQPHIYPQGSFRLGTVVRPIASDGEYDLDLGCRLRSGVTKRSHTQRQLKDLIGAELEAYRLARGIKSQLEEMHRCWRLKYADTLQFHMDTVPSIPETESRRLLIEASMTRAGTPSALAREVAGLTGAITDNRSRTYNTISEDWRISNSEGYARWFESRMRLAPGLLNERALVAKAARIEDLPAYRWKSPLQRTVQILKRHRDVMFSDKSDRQPISIIITTLAARAYEGETDIGEAIRGVLRRMPRLVNPAAPRVPNPVHPAEDFADKWYDAAKSHLNLEGHFRYWLDQASKDFAAFDNLSNVELLAERAAATFGTRLSSQSIREQAAGSLLRPAAVPALSFPDKPLIPSKPAGFARGI